MKLLDKYYVGNFEVLEYDVVSSTMDVAKNLKGNSVVMAQTQTSGRGKYNRKWESLEGNLCFSVILDVGNKGKDYSQLSFVSAVAMRDALISLIPDKTVDVQCKWPNDILINRKKLVGILLQYDTTVKQVVIGVGANVQNFPQNALYSATSLYNEGFDFITSKKLLEYFLTNFANLHHLWNTSGFLKIRDMWLKNAYQFKQEILIKGKDGELVGVFDNLDKDGTLSLRLQDDTTKKIKSGDIF